MSVPWWVALVVLSPVVLGAGLYLARGLRNWRRRRTAEICLVLLDLMHELQVHRGLSGALLDGRSGFRDDFEAVDEKLQRRLHTLHEEHGRRHAVFHGPQWQQLLDRWDALRGNWQGLAFTTNIAAHSELIRGLTAILLTVVQANRALLGVRSSTILAAWPALIEDLGLLRALGLHLVGHRREIDETVIPAMRNALRNARRRLRHVAETGAPRMALVRSERAMRRVRWLLDGNAGRYHPYTYYEEMTQVIDDWYGALRAELLDEPVGRSISERFVTQLRANLKTG